MVDPIILLAVDVGATSVRAGLFDQNGQMLATGEQGLDLIRPADGHAVYRMDMIWNSVGGAIGNCLAAAPAEPGLRIAALGFTATAALVLTHDGPPPLDGGANVFAAFDRRASAEAHEITAVGDIWIDHVGGSLTAESHLAKLLWLKRHNPSAWERVTGVHDLCDELARRATGVEAHSLAAIATQWPFLLGEGDNGGWCLGLLGRLDLAEIWTFGTMFEAPHPVGQTHGRLSAAAAAMLGLPVGIPVAVGMIDVQAGLLGALGRGIRGRGEQTLTLLGGKSTRCLAFSTDQHLIPGVAGPFREAVLPGLYLHEAVQSYSGAALDALLEHHPGGPLHASAEMHADIAAEILELLHIEGPAFAAQRHIVPDWQGNRSPVGDGDVRALATGLNDESSRRDFLEAYYATARALVLQARQILGQINRYGYAIKRVTLSGSHAGNKLLVRLYRDGLGVEIVLSDAPEPALLGAAMAASVAVGAYPDLFIAAERMSPSQMRQAADSRWRRAHDAAYRIYLKLFDIRNVIAEESRRLASLTDEV